MTTLLVLIGMVTAFTLAYLKYWKGEEITETGTQPYSPPTSTTPPTAPTSPVDETLVWDSPQTIRHSIRVICDQEGLSWAQKNDLCATVQAESGFKLGAVRDNLDKNGMVWSRDWGLCQWNDYWHGKEISPDEAVHNPEKAVRLMCAYWKRGQMNQWVAWKTGAYKRYL